MRKVMLVALILGTLGLLSLAPTGAAAPALGDKPVRYEYAELSVLRVAAGKGAGQPGGNFGPNPVRTLLRWTTGEEEVEVSEWSELADKLKAPAPKKESSENVHRLRVLNKLSANGWEMLDRSLGATPGTAGSGFSFRRRLP